jgi:hypothetical protein
MNSATKKVAIIYGVWALSCVIFSAIGLGDGKAGHLYLLFTGVPFALFSLEIIPNGSMFATFIAGLLGWLQCGSRSECTLGCMEKTHK